MESGQLRIYTYTHTFPPFWQGIFVNLSRFVGGRYSKQLSLSLLKIMKASVYVSFQNWYSFRVKKVVKSRSQNKIVVPLRGYFQKFRRAATPFLWGSSRPLTGQRPVTWIIITISRRNKRTVRNETFHILGGLNDGEIFIQAWTKGKSLPLGYLLACHLICSYYILTSSMDNYWTDRNNV